MSYGIVVIDRDGEVNYVCDGMSDRPTRFVSRSDAQDFVDFLKIGLTGDGSVQSINVVQYPNGKK